MLNNNKSKDKEMPVVKVGLLDDLAKGKYPTTDISTSVGTFTLKYPSGSDNMNIQSRVSFLLGGRPRNTYPDGYLNELERDVALSYLTENYPKDFPKEWEGNFVDYPLEEVKNSLSREFNTFRSEITKGLQGK